MSYPIRLAATAIIVTLFFADISSGRGAAVHASAGTTKKDPTPHTASPNQPATSVNVTVDVLLDRHAISPYVYGGSYPKDAPTISDSGLTVVRWGGNATSRYNWKTFTYNAAADW